MQGIVWKGTENKTISIRMPLHTFLVQPQLEHGLQFHLLHPPSQKKDILELERGQKWASKISRRLEHFCYEERLII